MVKDGEDLHGLQNNKIEKFKLNFSNSLTMSLFCISYVHVPQHSITNYVNTISTKTNLERGNRSCREFAIFCKNAKIMINCYFWYLCHKNAPESNTWESFSSELLNGGQTLTLLHLPLTCNKSRIRN